MKKTIIFSDLDGTLLDATSYSFNDALPALNLVQARAIPLIRCLKQDGNPIKPGLSIHGHPS